MGWGVQGERTVTLSAHLETLRIFLPMQVESMSQRVQMGISKEDILPEQWNRESSL